MDQSKYLIVIVGPTAVGKTALCVNLAKSLNTEIISADSRQFYREMSIGTAKPTTDEMGGVVHHFIDNLSIEVSYDIGRYEKDALVVINEIFKNRNVAILTGGSGMYVDAVCKGIDDMPEVAKEIRTNLNQTHEKEGLTLLLDKLKMVDPVYYQVVDQNNPQRVIRALEVYESTGKSYSSFRKSTTKTRPFKIIKIGLHRDRDELYARIEERMDAMIEQGLFDEAKSLYHFRSKNALQTVGYKEVFEYIDGIYDKMEAVRLLKRNSRRYAKRQMTWFRKDDQIKWFHPEDNGAIIRYLKDLID